ncbi:YjjW family glycine radical enzyme activase [Orbus sturtevantii]|uniref:YjjW family glycine radical enzyme activase n=1 Tax=Orbus sturtevantii TaxID=3074109 RepID=UPI00370D51EE
MNKTWAIVNKILPFSCVDGPGNRLVIFLQGCNFHCLNCHNPYTIQLCQNCGQCVGNCPNLALSFDKGKTVWQSEQCKQCDTCIQICPNQSSPMTYRYSVEEMLTVIRKYLPFLNGITFSGGEATLQLPFIQQLFAQIKSTADLKHLTCFIDSNGYLPRQGWQKVIPLMDGAMIDLKAWDNHVHKYLTGRDNQRVKDSINYLAARNQLYEVRLLLIPEQTDLLFNVAKIAEFLNLLPHKPRIRINAFHSHGVTGNAKNWHSATQRDVENFATQLSKYGLNKLTLPAVYLT